MDSPHQQAETNTTHFNNTLQGLSPSCWATPKKATDVLNRKGGVTNREADQASAHCFSPRGPPHGPGARGQISDDKQGCRPRACQDRRSRTLNPKGPPLRAHQQGAVTAGVGAGTGAPGPPGRWPRLTPKRSPACSLHSRLQWRLLLLGGLVRPVPVHSVGVHGTGWDLEGGWGFRGGAGGLRGRLKGVNGLITGVRVKAV